MMERVQQRGHRGVGGGFVCGRASRRGEPASARQRSRSKRTAGLPEHDLARRGRGNVSDLRRGRGGTCVRDRHCSDTWRRSRSAPQAKSRSATGYGGGLRTIGRTSIRRRPHGLPRGRKLRIDSSDDGVRAFRRIDEAGLYGHASEMRRNQRKKRLQMSHADVRMQSRGVCLGYLRNRRVAPWKLHRRSPGNVRLGDCC